MPQLGRISNMHFTEVVFINIAKHPHFGEIGDGKEAGAVVEALDCRSGALPGLDNTPFLAEYCASCEN
jgi:hypothetical protein